MTDREIKEAISGEVASAVFFMFGLLIFTWALFLYGLSHDALCWQWGERRCIVTVIRELK